MNRLPTSLRIGVLRGGPSNQYDTSLQSGAEVLKHISQTHKPLDIFVSKDGKWHMNGIEKTPDKILKNVDVAWNSMHGTYGEDGSVQDVLNHNAVPYVGSNRFESAVALNRKIAKEKAQEAGIKTPVFMIVRRTDDLAKKAKEVFNSIPHPLVVKPVLGGSKVAHFVVDSYTELLDALEKILYSYDGALVEEYISGKSAACAVINNFRGKALYTLPPAEIISLDDVNSPGKFSEKEKMEIEKVTKLIHDRLGLKHYSDSNFVVSPKRGVYFLEVNTVPRLHEKSFLPKSLSAVGIELKEFIGHLLDLAIHKSGLWI